VPAAKPNGISARILPASSRRKSVFGVSPDAAALATGQQSATAVLDAAPPVLERTATPPFQAAAVVEEVEHPAAKRSVAAGKPVAERRVLSPARPAPPTPSPCPKPTAGEEAAALALLRENFQKLADGRWSYGADLTQCKFADGLASLLKPPPGEPSHGLGDCLLCTNWNKRLGCAFAYSHDLEVRKHYEGLQLAAEQAIAWAGAGRFDMAIVVLGDYIRNNPNDPAGLRELARVYDHPDYRGRDKRRAVVLYERFAELAQQGTAFSKLEITRAKEHAAALRTGSLDARDAGISPGSAVTFQCFYRGSSTCFAYGVLTPARLVVAQAGNVDPDSGVSASGFGGIAARASGMFRRLTASESKADNIALARKELARLSALSVEDLACDPACVAAVAAGEMRDASHGKDQATGLSCVTLGAPQKHQLLFADAAPFKADQCYEMLHRMLAAR
jgi:hypothetical protein